MLVYLTLFVRCHRSVLLRSVDAPSVRKEGSFISEWTRDLRDTVSYGLQSCTVHAAANERDSRADRVTEPVERIERSASIAAFRLQDQLTL